MHQQESRGSGDALLRIAGRAARLGGWRLDLPDLKLSWSAEACRIHDMDPEHQPTLAETIEFYAPENRAEVAGLIENCIQRGTPFDRELEKLTATGRKIWVRILGEALRDDEGHIIGVQGAIQDMTERRQAENALAESRRALELASCSSEAFSRSAQAKLAQQAALLDYATDAIFVRDLEHRITYWNKSAERLYGWTAEEAIGRSALELLHQEKDVAAFHQAGETLLLEGDWAGDFHKRTKSGGHRTVEARWTLVRDEHGAPESILAINTDVTERKKLEQQFLRAQRMESIGTLAGGIAHDLNNALGPILLSLDLLKMRFSDPDSLELISMLEGSAKHGASMVRQVLSFSRGVEGLKVEVQVKHLIGDVQKIARETFPKNILVRSIISGELCPVVGDPTQLHQVLLNLCVNSRDAMPSGGTLTLSAENCHLDAHYAALNIESRPGPYIFIQVEDTGTGMTPEIIEKIFDPFFTTKELGKGTGLGLSTTLGIVKGHEGFLRVYSEPGKGTKFSIYLPAHKEALAEGEETGAVEMPRGNGELIMVVDDEPSVRYITQQTLAAFGYEVVLAADGVEAVALYAARRHEIAAVITDMMMPVMDGPDTIRVLQRLNPKVLVVAASGLESNGHLAQAASLGVKHFLSKPYTGERLLNVLKGLLANEG